MRSAEIPPGYQYLLLKDGDPRAPSNAFRYQDEKAVELQAREAAKAARSARAKRLAVDQGIIDDSPATPDLQVLKVYNSMRSGSDTYNKLHFALRNTANLAALVADRLEQLAPGYADVDGAPQPEPQLAKAVSNLQFWNPTGGKGVSRTKPDGTALGQLPEKLVDWFSE